MTRRRTILILAAIFLLGILIGFVLLIDFPSLFAGRNNQADSDLSVATYDHSIISPVGINEFENASSGPLDFVFTSTPSELSVKYCGVGISVANQSFQSSSCLDAPSNLNTNLVSSTNSGYQYETPSISLASESYNISGIQANVSYTSDGGTGRYSYVLFSVARVEVSVGGHPEFAAFDSANDNLYLTNYEADNVSEVSNSSDRVIATLGDFYGPLGIAYDPFYNELFVTNFNSSSVSIINGTTNDFAHYALSVGSAPYGIAYDPVNHNVYVTCSGSNSIVEIDAGNDTVVSTISGFNVPEGIAYDHANRDIYVANSGNGSVSVIDPLTGHIVSSVKVNADPVSVAYDASNGDMFVGTASSVDVINGSNEVVTSIPFAVGGPISLGFDPANGDMYLGETTLTEVLIYNSTLTQVGGILFSVPSSGLTYDLANTCMYVVQPTNNDTVGLLPAETAG